MNIRMYVSMSIHNHMHNFYMCMYFQPITQGEITETKYQVYSNETMDITSSTTLIFDAPSLPHNVFTYIVVVIVTAVNKYGIGPASEPKAAAIYGKTTFKQYFGLQSGRKILSKCVNV